jgi:hypothetical protein
MTIVTLVTHEVANLCSSIYLLALNALFLRDINICLCILCPEEGERDIVRTSQIQRLSLCYDRSLLIKLISISTLLSL